MVAIWAIGLVVTLGWVTLLWLVSLRLKDSSIIDIGWGPGFVILALVYSVLIEDSYSTRQLLVVVLVTVWGLRLGAHIFWRNKGKGEDPRYQKWRKAAGKAWW